MSDLDPEAAIYLETINDLNSVFVPHTTQILVGKSLFNSGKKRIFVKCGRKWGKTSFAVYCLFRFAMTTRNAGCYYIAPFLSQAKELVWSDRRLQDFFTDELIKKYKITFNNNEMRVRIGLTGSFIKVDGADNIESRRGINPHFAVIDESKDIKKGFWEGFEPNLAAHASPILIVGTPPDNTDNLFTHMEVECQDEDDGSFFNFPSWYNPHVSKDFLKKVKSRLIKRGEITVWQREYEAKTVLGGNTAIFPMLDEHKHVIDHFEMLSQIRRSRKQWDLVISFDPATASCFGVLLAAVNKYDKRIYLLDELYETDSRKNTSVQMYRRALEKMRAIHPMDDDWSKVYDYAAAWFAAEIANNFDEAITPCTKDLKNKDNKLSVIKDALNNGYLYISTNCKKTFWEMQNYRKDDRNRIIKENDHNIDNLRYILNDVYYDTVPEAQLVITSDKRGFTIEDDVVNFVRDDDRINKLENLLSGEVNDYY